MGAGAAPDAYSGIAIRRVFQLIPTILSPKPLLAVPFLKHRKQENNQIPKALERKGRQS